MAGTSRKCFSYGQRLSIVSPTSSVLGPEMSFQILEVRGRLADAIKISLYRADGARSSEKAVCPGEGKSLSQTWLDGNSFEQEGKHPLTGHCLSLWSGGRGGEEGDFGG